MDDWKEVDLESVAAELTVGHVGPMVIEYRESGVPFIRSTDIEPFKIKRDQLKYINPEFHARLKKSALKPGDVLIVRTGKPGTCAMIPDDLLDANCSDVVIVRAGPELHPRYLTYYVNSAARAHIDAYSGGAVQQHFNVGAARSIRMNLPPIVEQERIVGVLGALDDKIDLLHRQNRTLEAMAETLFRQWFVEEAEEGWETGRLDDLLVLQRGFDLPGPQRQEGPYPILAASGPSGGHIEFKVKGPGVTTGRSGAIGNVYYVHGDFWPLNTSLWVKEYKDISPAYAYHLLKTLDFGTYNSGSAVPTLNRNHVHGIEVRIPPADLLQRFDAMATLMLEKQRKNITAIDTLTALRDTLLPKLMSGEVRVEENY